MFCGAARALCPREGPRDSPSTGLRRERLLSLAASSSAQLLRDSGVLPAWQRAWHTAWHGCREGLRSVAAAPGVRRLARHRDLGEPLLGCSQLCWALPAQFSPCPPLARAAVPVPVCSTSCRWCRRSPGAGAARSRGSRRCLSRRSLSCRWLERSLPGLGSGAAAVLQPQLELLWAGSGEAALVVSQQCSALLAQLRSGLPWLAEWVRTVPRALQGTRDPSGSAAHRGL